MQSARLNCSQYQVNCARVVTGCLGDSFFKKKALDFAFLEQFVLGCFFEAKLKSFAGCVNKRQ